MEDLNSVGLEGGSGLDMLGNKTKLTLILILEELVQSRWANEKWEVM